MRDVNEDAAALLGLGEMVARSRAEKGGELSLEVETTDSVVGCGGWGTRATGRGRRRVEAPDAAGCGKAPVPGVGETVVAAPGAVVPDPSPGRRPTPKTSVRRAVTGRARVEIRRRVDQDEEEGRSGGSGLRGGLSL